MSRKLPVNKFKWIKDTSHFNEENYINFIMIYNFYLKELRLRKSKSM